MAAGNPLDHAPQDRRHPALPGPFWIALYGPSGSGKSTVGKILAERYAIPLVDLDEQISRTANRSIPEIFEQEGEAGFRQMEYAALRDPQLPARAVLSLGGGTLLNPENRRFVESRGRVFCLFAPYPVLLERLQNEMHQRPLLATSPGEAQGSPGETLLAALLEKRRSHYAAFPDQVSTAGLAPSEVAWQIQAALGWYRISGMGHSYDACLQPGGLRQVGEYLQAHDRRIPLGVATDDTVASFYANRVEHSLEQHGLSCSRVTIPAGEAHKTMATVQHVWSAFLEAGIERRSTILALGGGVVGDLAGFAAATFLRGVPWVALPTTLLAMVDASLGGKTGVDLPAGKNLVGAFHPPRFVLADPETLATLPPPILRAGMAEVIKHGVIGDPGLFALCEGGLAGIQDWPGLVSRAMGVKVRVIEEDPFEQGRRAALNFGHSIGHAVELVSGYSLSHGESVAIGMVAEARIAEHLGLAQPGLAEKIAGCLKAVGLPAEIPPTLDRERILQAIQFDKKKTGGKVRFALPSTIGEVHIGIEVPGLEHLVMSVL